MEIRKELFKARLPELFLSFDKAESKLGHPPTRNLSGRKAPRQKYSTFTATTDFLSTHASDDGHEELLAAANAVINPGTVLSGCRLCIVQSFLEADKSTFRFSI
ncbi:hypothetical protein Tco_0394578 [Tanacetum coccineum]